MRPPSDVPAEPSPRADSLFQSNAQALVRFKLANAWHQRGRLDLARTGYQQVLQLRPGFVDAHLQLGGLALQNGDLEQAIVHLESALALSPDDAVLRAYVLSLTEIKRDKGSRNLSNPKADTRAGELVDQPGGRLNLANQKTFDCHRSGWTFVLDSLKPFHHSQGVLFDGFLENNFAWRHSSDEIRPASVLLRLKLEGVFEELATSAERGITPYLEPWVGILHNPPNMPAWFHAKESPQTLMAKSIWRESLTTCLGFFTFSHAHADWLARVTQKPVSPLLHPTEIPGRLFDYARFRDNPSKKVIQIGWWLRRLQAIHELPLVPGNALGYEKIRLVPAFFAGADEYLRRLMEIERRETLPLAPPREDDTTRIVQHLANEAYDALLSENLAFVYLYDANANNAVVECIARGTPLLINRLPAVLEYLGADYPFYYEDLEEAAAKAQDPGRVRATHEYLMQCDTRPKLDRAYFQGAFAQSEVYRSLPTPG